MDGFEICLNDVLVDTFNAVLKYEEASLRRISNTPVTISEAHIIEAIGKLGGDASVSKVASVLNIAVPTATIAVQKLERKGIVMKTPCAEDGRRFIICLTETGKKLDRAHRIFHNKMVKNISGRFLDGEKEILMAAMLKLRQFFKEKIEARE